MAPRWRVSREPASQARSPLHEATAWLTSLELAGLSTTTQGDDDQHCDRCQSRESQSQSGESQSAHLEHVRGDVRGDRGDIPVQSGRSRTVTSTNWIQMRPPTMAATVRDPRERDPLNGQVASRRRSAGSHDHGELVARTASGSGSPCPGGMGRTPGWHSHAAQHTPRAQVGVSSLPQGVPRGANSQSESRLGVGPFRVHYLPRRHRDILAPET